MRLVPENQLRTILFLRMARKPKQLDQQNLCLDIFPSFFVFGVSIFGKNYYLWLVPCLNFYPAFALGTVIRKSRWR